MTQLKIILSPTIRTLYPEKSVYFYYVGCRSDHHVKCMLKKNGHHITECDYVDMSNDTKFNLNVLLSLLQ